MIVRIIFSGWGMGDLIRMALRRIVRRQLR